MVHRLDVNVGKIMKALKDTGINENTLVVFLSDNGGPVDQNASNNAPFNGQKGILLEGGIRVPFILKWDGVLPKSTVYDHPVSSLDLTPTFLSLAGIAIDSADEFDGVDLMPFLLNQKQGKPHETLKWRFTISKAMISGNWKLVSVPDRLPMLFDLSKDISEQHNVALENIELTKSMLKELGIWDISLPNPLFQEGPNWRIIQNQLYDKNYQLIQPQNK
jgi:arylsulfatase A-like enzyme